MKRLISVVIAMFCITSCGIQSYTVRTETIYGMVTTFTNTGDTLEVYPYVKLQEKNTSTIRLADGTIRTEVDVVSSWDGVGALNFYDMNRQVYVVLGPAVPYKAEYKHVQVENKTID